MDEELESDIISKIAIPTENLVLEAIQDVLYKVRTYKKKQMENSAWNRILGILWDHLQTGMKKFDDQLLCAVCFFTVLESSNEKQLYLDKMLTLIKSELVLKQKTNVDKDVSKESKTLQVVCLMYGIMQSKFVIHVCHSKLPILVDVLNSSLALLFLMAYEYSRYTFIVYKILSSLKIVCDTELQHTLFGFNDSKETDKLTDNNNIIKLMHIAVHNWENPITGVRDLNKSVFVIVVSICRNNTRNVMMDEINKFYWNKAKYLMLAILIEQYKSLSVLKSEWIDGLLYSLSKPGLVSAGADMYYAIIKTLRSEDEWCNLFLNKIIDVLHGKSNKSIENFCNYWCLTTFKKFPDLSFILLGELDKLEESEAKLYSSLCILKQANKLGLVNKNFSTSDFSIVENRVFSGIEHSNAYIRMLAFETVAVSLGKDLPTRVEYQLILNYLINNVNSDCTVLRISMLGNIKCFLTHLCASHMNQTKYNKDYETDELQKFYKDLQEFIIHSLNLNGNYQRKSTTIKLCNILLSSWTEVSKKRQKQTTTSGTAMVKFLKEKDCLTIFCDKFLKKLFELLKDPADDIRESVVQLLLDHYSRQITEPMVNILIEDAKDCIRSKFFFEISCGQSIFRLISSLLIKENHQNTIFRNIQEVFDFAFDILNSEHKLKRDIVKSIEDGKQMHAYLSILQEVLKVSKQLSGEVNTLKDRLPKLLNILEDMSDQFAWEEEPAVSSDFSKMSDMVQQIIASSGYNPLDEKDFAKISGLQQIVLNCLWLNVKASCDFASYLITLFTTDADAAACGRCLAVITHVLETSRHKGAIEAAGAALGRAIQHLTSLPPGPLPGLARGALRGLRALRAASVTRRGAGLSIMLHRVVAGDMAKGKPLFHYFMEQLLQTCNSDEAVPPTLDDGQKDVPKAIYIHFLTRIVTDSSLASDMMFYSADLAEIAFDNLTSPHWQIRNAALQLYGALIPKLIGQKKASGTDDETVATVAIDEFATHSPRLWQHMLQCLQQLDNTDTVQSHSNVLPILNVLANIAKRYNFDSDDTFSSSSEGLLESLMVLLGSPIYTVRRLTAKSIFNIYDYDVVVDIIRRKIMMNETRSENLIHGSLILVAHYNKHVEKDKNIEFQIFLKEYCEFVNLGKHSYVSKREFENLSHSQYNLEDILSETKCNKYFPGVFHWANNRLQKFIQSCPIHEIPQVLTIILKENDYEKYCDLILVKLETASEVPKEILTEIAEILIKVDCKVQSSVIWKILYHISLQVEYQNNIDLSIFEHIHKEVPYRIRYAVPYCASVASKLSVEYVLRLTNIIFSLCDPDKSDVDMRYIAALANNELAKIFRNVPDTVKISAIKCAVLLLQDEDEDVRMVNVQFYSNVTKNNLVLQPYVCLTKILNKKFLQESLDDPEKSIPILCEELLEIIVSYAKSEEIDEYNPFSNDSKNIYFESEVVKTLIQNVKG